MINRLSGQKIYLDTNVFIYAVEDHPTLAAPARALLAFIEAGLCAAYTSELTLAEVLVAPLRGGNQALTNDYKTLLSGQTALTLNPVSRPILLDAASIRAKTRQKLPDSIHAASAGFANCKTIISQDQQIKCGGLDTISLSDLQGGN